MLIARETIPIIYLIKWAEMHGIDKKDAEKAMELMKKLTIETDLDEDVIEALVIAKYQSYPVETVLDKFAKGKDNKYAGKLVEFTKY